MKPEVSVIIVNYNTFELTCKCIRSVKEKTHGLDYEIILVDNGSSEAGPDDFKNQFPSIKLVKSEENLGFAGGNNLGIKQVAGEFILLLNSDTELKNNAIKLCYDRIRKDNSMGAISCKMLNYDGSIQKQCNRMEKIGLELIELLRIHKLMPKHKRSKLLQGSYHDHQESFFTDKIWGTFFMFPRKILNDFPNQRLHDDFFMYGEDVQWSYFIRKKLKKKILYYPKAVIYHLGGGSVFNKNKRTIQIKHRYATLQKYYTKFYLKIYGVLHYLHLLSNGYGKSRNAKLIFSIFVKRNQVS